MMPLINSRIEEPAAIYLPDDVDRSRHLKKILKFFTGKKAYAPTKITLQYSKQDARAIKGKEKNTR